MSDTPRFGLPLVAAAQAQKHVTVNEALSLADALMQPVAQSASLPAPPDDPPEGTLHIVPAGASGAWNGRDGQLALWLAGAWHFRVPFRGMAIFIADSGHAALFDTDRGWTAARAFSAHGAATAEELVEGVAELAGASVDSEVLIPARSIVLAVSTRTIQGVTGVSSYHCGVAGEPSKFGGSLGIAVGATNVGVIGPTAFYADTPVRITAGGGAFTAGRVRIAVHCLLPLAPLS